MANAITEATPLLEERGAINYQIRELASERKDKDWTAEDLAKLEALEARDAELKNLLESMAMERDQDTAVEQRSDFIERSTGVSKTEQHESLVQWEQGLRGYLAGGWQGMSDRDLRSAKQAQATIARMEKRDQNIGTPADGGYLTHPIFVARMIERMEAYIGISQICDRLVTPDGQKLLMPTEGPDEGELVAEAGPITATTAADIEFGQVEIGAWKASSKFIKVSWELLQDSRMDLLGRIERKMAERIGRTIERYITIGAGTTEPLGFATAARATQTIVVDAQSSKYEVDVSKMIDMVHADVDEAYAASASAAFAFHRSYVGQLRKLDVASDKNAVFQPGLTLGSPDRLLGYPIVSTPNMAAYGATINDGTRLFVFGDFSRYMLRLVQSVTLLRANELFMANGQVGFTAWQRFDGKPLFAVDESTAGAGETSPIVAAVSDDGA